MAKRLINRPDIMDKWDYERNIHLDPEKLTTGQHIMANWLCKKCGYSWEQMIVSRAKTKGTCPCCEKNKRGPKARLMVVDVPEVMACWADTNTINPTSTNVTKHVDVDLECPDCGYKWTADLNTIYYAKLPKCPACKGDVVTETYNAASMFPRHLFYYDYSKPDNPKLDKLKPFSKQLVAWDCPACGSKWGQSPKDRVQRKNGISVVSACPFCNDTGVVKGYLIEEHPDIAEDWDEEVNETDCAKVHSTSTEPYAWRCKNNHPYRMSPYQRVRIKLMGSEPCPFCNGKAVMPGYNSFAVKHKNDILNDWFYPYNYLIVDPDTISEDADEIVWWEGKCKHRYEMAVNMRVEFFNRVIEPCPVCKGRRRQKKHFIKNE